MITTISIIFLIWVIAVAIVINETKDEER